MGSRGVVPDDTADGSPIRAGRIRSEHEAVATKLGVELGEHDARLDTHPSACRIDIEHLVQVLREIDDDRSPDCLPSETAPPAAR